MSTRTAKVKLSLCPHCVHDGGWHYDEDGNASRPHHDQARQEQQARELSEAANEAATQAARLIMRDIAATRYEFSANDTRQLFDDAQIPDPVQSTTFGWAARDKATADGALIEPTGRFVQSSESSTRHRIIVWRSRCYRAGRVA